MKAFDPFLTIKTDYVEELVTEIIIESGYDDVGDAVTAVETVILLLANLMRSYSHNYMFEITSDKEGCEVLQNELNMTYMNYKFITKTMNTMERLGYIDRDDNYYYMTNCCPLAEMNLKVYNRLEQN